MELAILLKRLRDSRGLSQEELSRDSGVSVRSIRNLERGVTRPHPATVRALATGLRLTEEDRDRVEAALAAVPRRAGQVAMLPAAPNRLVGRQTELAALVHMVRRGRCVAVVGPGGVGKSRLALAAAWEMLDDFDSIDVLDLGPLRDRDQVLGSLAIIAGTGTVATPAAIAAAIADQRRLVVLDGVEHVPDIGADLTTLVDRCPRLHLLLTSRTPPAADATVWSLDPLPLPDPSTTEPSAALASPAVELLVERVRARRPEFTVDPSTVEDVVEVCRRLDGLPLAIELAAGLLAERGLGRVAAELTVRILRTDLVDVPPRQRSLTATVEWSIALLGDVERLVFQVLGVFRGRVMVDALAAVLATVRPVDNLVAGPLSRLAAASLLRLSDGATVVDLLDTIRGAALEELRAAEFVGTAMHAHATHMIAVLRSGDAEAIDRQFDDIRAAVEFACDNATDLFDRSVVSALADHLGTRGRFAEAHRLLAAVAVAVPDAPVADTAWLRAGISANQYGDHRAALACGRAAARSGSGLLVAARNLIGAAHKSLGELDDAAEAYSACLAEAEAAGEIRYVTVALNNLGTVAHDRGNLETASDYYQRSLEIKTGLDDERGIATSLVNLGGLEHDACRPTTAAELLTRALERFRRLGEPHAMVFSLALLAAAQCAAGDLEAAARSANEAMELASDIENGPVRAMACQAAGELAWAGGDAQTAAACYVRALAYGPEPFERARLLDRLAVAVLESSPEASAAHAAEAERIRARYGYALLPVDAPLIDALHKTRESAVRDRPAAERPRASTW